MKGSSARLTSSFFTEGHLAIAQSVDIYLDRLGSRKSDLLKGILEEHCYPDELMAAMAELGIYGALIPEAYGGTGVGLLAMVVAMERFSAYGLENTLALLATMDSLALLKGGSEAQKLQYLPRVADGSLKLAFAITEPDAGSNSFNMRLAARKSALGYVISGQKAWITGVDRADMMLVVARSTSREDIVAQGLPKSFGLSLFLVPTTAPGLVKQEMQTAGIEGFSQFHLYFDDVALGPEALIGEENMGASILFDALNPERIVSASFAVGMTDYFLNKAVEYSKTRKVFGERPIGAYQGVAHPLARIRTTQEAARLLMYQAAESYDQKAPAQVVGTYANMAKYLASENCFEAADRAIQTFGGSGFVEENMLIQMLAPARLSKTAPINNEMVLNYIAEHELGMPRSY